MVPGARTDPSAFISTVGTQVVASSVDPRHTVRAAATARIGFIVMVAVVNASGVALRRWGLAAVIVRLELTSDSMG